VYCGDNPVGEITASTEGAVEWVRKDALLQFPVVEDLPVLLERVHSMKSSDPPFSARSYYDKNDLLRVEFND
jgi:hypothetical protein